MTNSEFKATVFIPTYNGARYLRDILEALSTQEVDYPYEVLIIDSGSRDGTLEIIREYVRKFVNFRLHEIPNSEFGHGRTRNLAAKMAKGEYVVFISHDAIPSHKKWLYEMISAFGLSPRIAGVMGKQIPRRNCFPLLKYEIQLLFAGLGPDFGTTIFYKDEFIQSQSVRDCVTFYSDVNSAARRDVLLNQIPYRDVPYSEDQFFGRDVIEAGLYKVYAPRASVVHSNDLELREYRGRMFDEAFTLRKSGVLTYAFGAKSAIKAALLGIASDSVRIVRDRDFTWRSKLYWLVMNPLYHIEKVRGVYSALSVDLGDTKGISRNSLECKVKSGLSG